MSDDNTSFSRRRLLGGIGTIGAAGALGGAATTSLLWDEEKFGNATDPNVLQAGTLDLKVDWDVRYYNWIDDDGDGTIDEPDDNVDSDGNPVGPGVELLDHTSSDNEGANEDGDVDDPGPLVRLVDIKPGDVLEATLSAHVYGNPAFLGIHYEEHADTEGDPPSNEPEADAEDATDAELLDDDGGELDDYLNVIVWYDDGDNLPGEIWTADGDPTQMSTEEFATTVGDATAPEDLVDTSEAILAGTLDDLDGVAQTLDSRDSVSGQQAGDFPESQCYENSVTEFIGVLVWLPTDIPGVNDNIVQGDRFEFQFGFNAIQCRHNVANDGSPIAGTIREADAEGADDAEKPDA